MKWKCIPYFECDSSPNICSWYSRLNELSGQGLATTGQSLSHVTSLNLSLFTTKKGAESLIITGEFTNNSVSQVKSPSVLPQLCSDRNPGNESSSES